MPLIKQRKENGKVRKYLRSRGSGESDSEDSDFSDYSDDFPKQLQYDEDEELGQVEPEVPQMETIYFRLRRRT